ECAAANMQICNTQDMYRCLSGKDGFSFSRKRVRRMHLSTAKTTNIKPRQLHQVSQVTGKMPASCRPLLLGVGPWNGPPGEVRFVNLPLLPVAAPLPAPSAAYPLADLRKRQPATAQRGAKACSLRGRKTGSVGAQLRLLIHDGILFVQQREVMSRP